MSDAAGTSPPAGSTRIPPRWKPISSMERRVLGVLGEKAKTTPDQYPLSLNGVVTGCNQKSNRSPQMTLEPHQVEDALERLRAKSAVSEVQGSGRVPKYRHHIYEWMGVEGAESAVMIELLLRGAQSLGELRGRAARMSPIADINALRPIVQSLISKGLVVALTDEGRGQIVTHSLYLDQEWDKVRAGAAAAAAQESDRHETDDNEEGDVDVSDVSERASTLAPPRSANTPSAPRVSPSDSADEIASLRAEVRQLRAEFDKLKNDVQDLWANLT